MTERSPDAPTRQGVLRAVATVRAEIRKAALAVGRSPDAIRLIAVSKSQGPEVLPWLLEAGVLDCGENRIDHLDLMRRAAGNGLRFHAIGRVQGRQFPELVRAADCLHSLADPGHLDRLVQAAAAAGKAPFPVYVQVNTSGEQAKAGLAPEQAARLIESVRTRPELQMLGLMTMAPLRETHGDAQVQSTFEALSAMAKSLGIERLSMGMSDDFGLAVRAGSTDVRIGSRLFRP